ncbi:MAG TPA: hypothetical protein VFM51_04415 [Solirubrobacterales bacterium]|nr:hypothetical protein [Solirubrobacterales bacterium]
MEPSPSDPPAPAPTEDPAPSEEEEAEAAPSSALSLEEIQRVWPAILQKLHEAKGAHAATFDAAQPVGYDEEGLRIGFGADQAFAKRQAEARREVLVEAVEAVTGQKVRPIFVLLDGEAPPDTPAPGSDQIDEEELLERLKSEFDAEEVG